MPIISDFTISRFEDANATIALTPPVNVSGWPLQFALSKRAGADPIFLKSCSSGFNNVSGINVLNPLQGIFNVTIKSTDVSGLDPGNYAWSMKRQDYSGHMTTLAEGFMSYSQ